MPLLVLLRLVEMALELVRHAVGNLSFGFFDRGQRFWITQLFAHGFGTRAGVFGNGVNLPLIIDSDIAAPITACQYQPLRQQSLDKGFGGIRYGPAILKNSLDVFGI